MGNKEQTQFTDNPWIEVAPGVKRQVLGYQPNLMLVRVAFDKDSIGAPHEHPHQQVSFIESGSFEVEIAGKKQILNQGDSFVVPGKVRHGVICLKQGVLIDAFSPMREDFISN